ncbi:FAD-dependent oxidoreductase [Rhodoferax sp. UBA5149]|uniref:FAD-dependent oxidoreductase n=1 Tax=Rhodoferax sp. UBA5149 TaxID=1947379 RepID=UPI0025DE8AA3|nr:FAD-dependent oxidoreductase [Rhodoferax sp. UBA5149]
MTATAHPQKHLVLLGAGHAHVHVLSTLAAQPLPGVQVTLIAPYPRQLYSDMVPGFVAGHHALEDCVIALAPLLKNTGVRWLTRSVMALDAKARTVTLDDGSELAYHWLSVNTEPVQDRKQVEQALPGAREHGLFLRPMEAFAALWPQVVELAQNRALRVAVIGGGAAGIELAMAIQYRLPGASVTLITGGAAAGANDPPAVQRRIVQALRRRNITVLPDLAVGIQAGEVFLGCGARLACDVPVIATVTQAPAWLGSSGLVLTEDGFIAVDACQRSTSHTQVFAAGDVSTRVDRPLARSGMYAVRTGPALRKNLAAAVAGAEPSPHEPAKNTLNLLSCGQQEAIASWGNYSAQGRWVWLLKDWIDRSFIKRYRRN